MGDAFWNRFANNIGPVFGVAMALLAIGALGFILFVVSPKVLGIVLFLFVVIVGVAVFLATVGIDLEDN